MKSIALSLLLVFTMFTMVLSTYYLWQDSDFQVTMPVEEEEDHGEETPVPFTVIFDSNQILLQILSDEETQNTHNSSILKCYEDVYLNSPFSPPDMM